MKSRREWFQMMAALSAGAVVDALIPRAARGRVLQEPDRTAAFRAQIGAAAIRAQQLGENLTLLSGPGGNIVVLHGTDGLVMVDTFVAPAWPRLEESLKPLGARVKFVINTHWHFDHTDNNAALHAAGATVVAHENTKRRMAEPHHVPMLELDFPPSPSAALPQRVFKDGYKLEANGEKLEVSHVAPAHTDTDVIVRFERANLVHAGDVYFNGRYPFIDWSTGGRIDGMIAGAERLLSLADADTKIVPGHGPLAAKADLVRYHDMLNLAADRVRNLKASGKSLEEAIAAKPFTDLEKDWGSGRYKGDDFVKIVYSSL
ncbi:MAG TPA: MBL fold metallo-hydrolase [Gemmatimonadales bacterium]|nr:MBL fold metallo-hydrolase [Gemmatimonadales bacterium]